MTPKRPLPARKSRGFTLIELMVAIAIFAVLGIMSALLLNNMISQHDIIDERGQRLVGLQRSMTIIQRDINHIVSRKVRDEYGEPQGSLVTDDIYPIEFSRTGWRNPLEHPRSELQRVAYEHRETTLYRYYWSVLDRAIDSEPQEQVLMEDVLAVDFEVLDGYGDAYVPANATANNGDPRLHAAALSVRFEFEGYGEITRLWELPDSLDRDPGASSNGPSLPGGNGNETTNGNGNPTNNSTNNSNNSGPGANQGRRVSADPQEGDGR